MSPLSHRVTTSPASPRARPQPEPLMQSRDKSTETIRDGMGGSLSPAPPPLRSIYEHVLSQPFSGNMPLSVFRYTPLLQAHPAILSSILI